jgi:hypothetical protein
MINIYLRGRACIESDMWSFYLSSSLPFWLGLPLFVPLLVLCLFLLLDGLLELSLAFGLVAVLHGVLDSNFKLYAFRCQWTHQGGD